MSSSNPKQTYDYSSNYKGVSLCKQSGKYEAYLHLKKKRGLCSYILPTDVPLAVDLFSEKLGSSSPVTFACKKVYNMERNKELTQRQIDVLYMEVLAYLT